MTLDPVVELARRNDTTDRAVIATDLGGTVLYWGSGAEALYAWKAPEVLGRSILDVTPTDLSRTEAERIMRALQEGRSWSGDFVVTTKTGRRFVAYVTDIPVQDPSGSLAGIIGISRRSAYTLDLAADGRRTRGFVHR